MDNQAQPDNTDSVKIGQTTYEVYNFFDGEQSLLELLKNALRRDAQAVLRQQENPYI